MKGAEECRREVADGRGGPAQARRRGGRNGGRSVPAALLDVIVPSTCSLCGEWVPGAGCGICDTCTGRMQRLREPVCDVCGNELVSSSLRCRRCRELYQDSCPDRVNATRCRGVFTYDETVAAAMARFKAHGDIRLAGWVAWELASLCDALWPGALLVPVPGSPRNARRRGWDHMEEVARELRRRGIMTSRLLTRRDGPEQKGLDREARRTSVSRSLVLRDARRLRVGAEQARPMPRTVVLIDDVRTTGATIEAAATLLRCGGYSVEGAAMLAVR